MTRKTDSEKRLEVHRYIEVFDGIEKRLTELNAGPYASELHEMNTLWNTFDEEQKEMFYEWYREVPPFQPTIQLTSIALGTPATGTT